MTESFSPEYIEHQTTRLSKPLINAGEFAEKVATRMSAEGFPSTASNAAHTYSEFSQTLQACVAAITRMGEFSLSQLRATATDYRTTEQNNETEARSSQSMKGS